MTAMAKSPSRPPLASRINGMIEVFSPSMALSREAAMTRRAILKQQAGHFQGAGRGHRGKDFRANTTDATEAMRADRQRMSWIGRDMLRNNPRVVRIRRQLVGNVVATGIRPSIKWKGASDDPRKIKVEELVRAHCLKTRFDADGLKTMLGQQSQAFGTIVTDGEVLLRRRFRRSEDGLILPFQVQVLETDYLNAQVDGDLTNGNYAVQGIEFNRLGQRVAYHLYKDHPGGRGGAMPATTRVDARNVIHAFDPVRPGQQRGVSWLAPVVTLLHELQKYQDGQVKRQEIASLFAGVLKSDDAASEMQGQMDGLQAGAILALKQDEDMEFTDPPSVDGYEPFMNLTDRVIAAGMGITYEALTGDYSKVNYTSGRMGRMDVEPNIRDWQENLMIAQICDREAEWIAEAIEDAADIPRNLWEMVWTPPVRPVVDPTKDYKAAEVAMRSGQKSKRQVIREGGGDPEKTETEIAEERSWANERGLVFSSDAGASAVARSDSSASDDTSENEEGKTDGK